MQAEVVAIEPGLGRIERRDDVMGGQPCVRATRVTVDTVLGALCDWDRARVCDEFDITLEDLQGALDYAAHVLNQVYRSAEENQEAAAAGF